MKIAAVVNKNNEIVPIVEGGEVVIFEAGSLVEERFANPALERTEGRRGATLSFAIDKGVSAFATPPQTFCQLSYAKAINSQIEFYRIAHQSSLADFKEQIGQLQTRKGLPEEEVALSIFPTANI